jgi:hypothetical protein
MGRIRQLIALLVLVVSLGVEARSEAPSWRALAKAEPGGATAAAAAPVAQVGSSQMRTQGQA